MSKNSFKLTSTKAPQGMSSKEVTLSLNKEPLLYNPNKTNFEQMLECYNYIDNPDITYDDLKDIYANYVVSIGQNIDVKKLRDDLEEVHLEDHGMYVYKKYIRDGKQNYNIAKDFSTALSEASLDISCKYIPRENKSYCVHFHKEIKIPSLFGEEEIKYRNCYVSVEDCDTEYDRSKGYHKRIMLIFPVYINGTDFYSTYDFVNLVFKDDNQKVTEALEYSAATLKGRTLTEEGTKTIKYLTNVVLYLNSGDPDLRELKKPKIPKVAKNIKKFHKKNKHKPLLDIIEVGFNYMKGIKYHVSSTMVRGHFRWQPCGVGLQQVKLIWIGEHPRNFDNK